MPVIPLLRDKKKKTSERKKQRQSLYQRSDYRRNADWYKRKHIWCEDCKAEGLYTPGTDIHHIISPFKGDRPLTEQLRLLMDESNWKLLCNFHHRLAHHTASQKEIDDYNNKINKK